MVRPPSFDSNGIKKGSWSDDEDQILRAFVLRHGHTNWRLLPKLAGLQRCGKSCRLRWVNYLKPGIRRGNFSKEEEDLIIKLHSQVGNQWSMIASNLAGRTDNDIKNYWHAHIQKRMVLQENGAARKSIMPAQTPQDQSSCDQINSACITTDDDHQKEESVFDNAFAQGLAAENPGNIDALMNPINGDAYLVAQGQGGVWSETYDDQITCFSRLSNIDVPPFKDEAEFHGFGLGQNEMLSTFSDSSDGGITSWNSSSSECDQVGNFWSDELPFGEDSLDIWCFGDDHI